MNEPTSSPVDRLELLIADLPAAVAVRRSGVSPWRMSGEDRARFLNGLVTCPVTDLQPGQGTYGFVTSTKGKVLADLVLVSGEDEFLLELPAEVAEVVVDHILRYRIADRVELDALSGSRILTVAGRGAEALLAAELGEVPEAAWAHRPASLGGVEVRVVRRGFAPLPAWDLWCAEADEATLRDALAASGFGTISEAAWDRLRVAAGVPRFGVDFDAANLPQETGLEEWAVNYEKGCYLGQEVVARIHYRGGVNKGLVGLELVAPTGEDGAPGGLPQAGVEIRHDGRSAGRLGTVVESSVDGLTAHALAILHRRAGEPGTVVQVEGAGDARVVTLPGRGGPLSRSPLADRGESAGGGEGSVGEA